MNFSGRAHAHRLGDDCPFCGEAMVLGGRKFPTRDHLTPRSRGGSDAADNALIVYAECNADKADRTLWEWLEALQTFGDARAARVRAALEGLFV
jgi:5-methylcytosine-specific restriction endonuclease McrA